MPHLPPNPLVEVLGAFYEVEHQEGAVSVEKLTVVRAPLKTFKVDRLAAIPAYKACLKEDLRDGRITPDHIAVLHEPIYEPNPNQFIIRRCYGILLDADDAEADDKRILRLFRSLAPSWQKHPNAVVAP